MRMSVLFGGAAVSRPACVAHSIGAVKRVLLQRRLKIAELSFGTANLQFIIAVNDGDARRIIATVFKLPQAINDQRHHRFVSNVSDYSTHKVVSSSPREIPFR